MKRKRSKHKQLGVPSLFIIGGGFAISILLGLFFLNYNSFLQKNADYSYADLKQRYAVIKDIEAYDFMRDALLDGDSVLLDSMEFTKIKCFSIKHSSDLKSFINSIDDSLLSVSERKYMLNQLTDEMYLWDNERLINAWCLTPKDLAKIKASDDYWEGFSSTFGNYGYHCYSKPIFNQKNDICIIEHVGRGDWTVGSGGILLFTEVTQLL